MNTSWSLGVLIGLPILGLVALGVLAWIVFWFWAGDGTGPAVGGIVTLLIVGGVALSPLGYYPYKAEYHQWRPVTGEVQEVSKRLVSSGDSMEEKIVIKFDGEPREYGCNDTRCSLAKKGDYLDLKCKRAWQYASVSGYDCRFIARRTP